MPERGPNLDEELDPLPPLDGDAQDKPEPEPTFEDLVEDAEGDPSLDDSTGEDAEADASELDLEEAESGWLEEPADAPDLDLGDIALVDFGKQGAAPDGAPPASPEVGRDPDDEADDPSPGDHDFGFGDAPERGDLDGGDEGPLDADEELRESDLPQLDADEDGDVDEASLVDAGFAADEPLGLPWAGQPWARVGAPVALGGATAVDCAPRGALVAARNESGAPELARVDLEGTCQGLPARGLDPGAVRGLSIERDVVAAGLEGGGVLVSRDGGASFAAVADAVSAVEAVVASGTVWLRTRTGGLMVLDSAAVSLQRCAVPGAVAALARAGTLLAALVVGEAECPECILRGAAGPTLRREPVAGPEAASPALLAVRGDHLAYAARLGGVAVGRSGDSAREFVWEGRVTAIVFVDDEGTLVAATYSAADDTTALVRVDGAAQPSVVARIGPASGDPDADGRVHAMAFDEARGVVWVAGGFGVAAFSVR